MKRKLKKRLEKRLKKLPLHHIDTSIILEPRTTKSGFYCKKYFNLVGYKYRGVFSLPVLGEVLYKILKIKELGKRYDALDLIFTLVRNKNIDFYSVKGTEEIIEKIKEIDPSITPTDRLILACAIAHKAKVLVTIDTRLIKNKLIEDRFKIRVEHPKSLV